MAVGLLACAVVALAWMMNTTKTGLLPEEDMGSVMVNVTTPPGSSVAQTAAVMEEIEKRMDSIPEIKIASETAGYGLIGGAGPSSGMIIAQLTDWSERKSEESGIDAVLAKINGFARDIPGVQIFAMAPPLIDGYGVSSGFEIYLQDRAGGDITELYDVGQTFIAALMERPEIGSAYTTFNVNFPQYLVEVAAANLPRGYGYEFAGISREESQTSSNTAVIFLICTVFVYLILCGLYESFFVPFAVILSVPFGLMGSFLFAKLMGLENNIYMQTGLIMLIGLLSKTAILLTEYASERRKSGMSLVQAALAAAKVRLRPILMTILAMIFGLLPLMFASGVGANGNSSLGSGVIGGMLFGTLGILFLVPVFFIIFQYMQEKVKPVEFLPHPDWQIESEMDALPDVPEEPLQGVWSVPWHVVLPIPLQGRF